MTAAIKALFTLTLFSTFDSEAIDLRIDNLRIYNNHTESFSQPSSLFVDNGKIIKIMPNSSQLQTADNIINANNQYAVPGLSDLHVHLGSSGSNYTEFQYLPVESHFNSNLYLGITNIVDLFSFDKTINEAKKLTESQLTPNFFYAGTLFTNPGGHGSQFGFKPYEISTDADIENLWKQHIATNPSVTKAIIETFGGLGTSLTDTQLAELGRRSKVAGLPYFVHISTLDDAIRAIKAGATALAHGVNSEAISDEFITLMKVNNVAYIPTLAVYHNHHQEKLSQFISSKPALLKTVPKKLHDCLFNKVSSPSKWSENTWQARDVAYKNIVKLQNSGVTIGTGSDAGNPYTLHGVALHNELMLLNKAGLTNAQIINASTSNAAKIIQQSDKIGQIKLGYEASFLILANDPLVNIENLQNITAVYKSGNVINREQLIAKNQQIIPQGKACHVLNESISANKVIDDFSGKSPWNESSDIIMGGESTTKLTVKESSLLISTSIGKPTNFGAWAGAEIKFPQQIDASKFQGITITYKGSATPFSLSIYHAEVKDWDHFSTLLAPSNEWTTVNLAFENFKQFGFGNQILWSASKLTGLNIMWRKTPGAASTKLNNELAIKELTFY